MPKIRKRVQKVVTLFLVMVFIFAGFPAGNVVAQSETPYTAINWMVSQMDGSLQPYGVFIPSPSDKDTPRPVLFIGHGAPGRASIPAANSNPQKWILDNGKNWIVVRLDFRGHQANNQGQFDVFDVIRDLEEVEGYTLDHDRFYITGGSLGGSDTYRMGLRYPDLWAAIAPQTGWTDYREFWPHWYEHWDKDTVHRGSMFEGFRSTNLNVRNNVTNLTYFVDPVLEPMLETASPLWYATNGMHVPAFIMSCYDDPTNLRINQEQVRDVYEENGYEYAFKQLPSGGHGCAVLDWNELMPWFDEHVRVSNPLKATYTTNSLQYNKAYWIQLDAFVTEKEWATLTAAIDEATRQSIDVETENLSKFTLKLNDELIADMAADIVVTIDGVDYTVAPSESLTFTAVFDENNELTGWESNAITPSAAGTLVKKNGLSGPFSDAFFSPFVVVYSTKGSEAENADSLRSAQEFAMEWNNWMILHIGNYNSYQTSYPAANVWEGISTFPYYEVTTDAAGNNPAGPNAPGGASTEQVNTWIVRPIRDVDVTLEMIESKNLIIFGEPHTNALLARMEDALPFEFAPGSITVEGRTYADGNNPKDAGRIDYSFIYPNPANPDKYIAVSRYGLWMDWKDPSNAWLKFTSTGIEFQSFDFQFPDYFIGWRLNDKLMDGVHGMYFQDTWFEAGYFNNNWQLDTVAPITKAEVTGTQNDDWYSSPVSITLTANDNPGGFGVDYTEYSLDGGNTWNIYDGTPITLTEEGTYNLVYRSVDKSGKFEFGMIDPWVKFGKEFPDGEQWLSSPSWANAESDQALEIKIGQPPEEPEEPEPTIIGIYLPFVGRY